MNDGKLRFYSGGKEILTIDDSSWGKVQTPKMQLEVKQMTHEEMLEVAERRELANKTFEELTKDQKIQLALEELDWIVIGGQDGEEFYNSIQFLRKVLESFK